VTETARSAAQAGDDQPMRDRAEARRPGAKEGCPLCGDPAGQPLFEKGGHRYARCRRCGFQYGRSPVNANFPARLDDYEPAYRQYLETTAVDEANHDALLAWIERYATLTAATRVLDVGAGSGKWLRYLEARRPCRLSGLEPSAALFSGFDLDARGVLNQTLPAFAESHAGERFDVVTVLDVIEHVEEPLPFAQALAAVTRPGGLVFLSTPDAGSVVAGALGRYWHHRNRYHFSLFDRSTIRRLGADTGFETVAMTHRGKRFTAGYLRDYVRDFLLPGRALARSRRASRQVFSINLYDIMSAVWRRMP
jgi:SAM-dependent methyltransferase